MTKTARCLSGVALVLLTIMTVDAQWQQQRSNTDADFRGLCAVSKTVAWASGTKGTFARTTDGGASWQVGNVPEAASLDFRDVDAFDASTAYLLSIGNGESSRIYKTTDGGKTWSLQFRNTDKDAFFDAMAFWDARNGIAFSDPVNGKFVVITTNDGGKTWEPVSPAGIPAAISGEGGFAASGTCITVEGKSNVWLASGGAATARVYRSTDRGKTWAVADTPIQAGVASAGIFSIAFRDANNGIAVGGDYRKPNDAEKGVAVTTDGGKTWRLAANATGFRSAIAYAKHSGGIKLFAVGTSGSDYSTDNGASWVGMDKENYNAVSIAKDGAVWAAGPKGRIARLMGHGGAR